jgi:hypothetical protein
LEEEVYAFKEVDESIMVCYDTPHSLRFGISGKNRDGGPEEKHTPRRTPIPVKIAFAGENG